MTSKTRAALAAIAALTIAAPAQAQADTAVSPALARRSGELLAVLNGGGRPDETFAPEFLKAVPEGRLREVAASVRAQLGRATAVNSITARDASHADLAIAYERGRAHAFVVLAPDTRVIGFVIDRIEPADIAAMRSLDEIAGAFARLPGVAGFAVSDIEPGSEPQSALEPGRPLAIGSTFKLVILAELVRAIDAGERKWTDTVTLGTLELPAGGFNQLQPGTRVTLRRLAEEMIRVSDNSATDLLLHELGRRKVEGMLGPIGFSYADWNVPFLSTMELFKLKGVQGGTLGRRYLDADPIGRRQMLKEVARLPGSAIDRLYANGQPVLIDALEWFATPADLVRTMGWFARHRETAAGAEALRILSLNPGPAAPLHERFGYVGYKGGSEPGVVSMTVLLRDKVARWKVVTATWNDPAAPVDEARFGALMGRALEIVAGG
ncbi:serine hydrolase [Novosphingobium sp. 9U]|uniref:serine hydrolase n=1 Tax=Novosphingobium sp. 9U TaxID=2653158 RepID=UPI0012EEE56B|nr:serine hydrolase [Novosphingobium sp. 9U]VWX53431.1 Beta-lactamase [Novosphingobium sp. 9U]